MACKQAAIETKDIDTSVVKTEDVIKVEPRSVTMNEYAAEVLVPEETSLIQEKNMGDFSFQLRYEPCEALIIKDNARKLSKEEFSKEVEERSTMLFFTLKINNKNFVHKELLLFELPSQEEYMNRLNYYSFKVQNDLTLKIGETEIPCGMAHFERTFGLAPGLTISLAFPVSEKIRDEIMNKKLTERITVVFEEKIFNNGTLQFSFHPNTINAIPKPIIE